MPEPRVRKILEPAIAYLLAAAGLFWVFHDVAWAKLLRSAAGLDWRWAALGVLSDMASYAGQGVRWRLLLKPVGPLSVFRSTQAIYAGLFAGEIFPLHLGQLARAFPVSAWIRAPLVAVLPSMALERIFDGIWLAAGIGITSLLVPLPRNLLEAGDLFVLAIIVLTGITLFFLIGKGRDRTLPRRAGRGAAVGGIAKNLRILRDGFRSIGFSRLAAGAFSLSLPIHGLQILGFWLLMEAFGFDFSFWIGAAVFLIVRLGTLIPGPPGSVGLFQFFCVIGLTLFGADKTAAAGFSVVSYMLLSIPFWIVGSLALGGTGMSLASIRASVRKGEIGDEAFRPGVPHPISRRKS